MATHARRRLRRACVTSTAFAVLLTIAACGGGGGTGEDGSASGALTVYSGRSEEFVGPLLAAFERESGIDLEIRYGDSAELAATILEEGDASPADVFFSQDAGSLGAVAEAGMLRPLSDEVLDRVDAAFRSPDGRWVGTSGRGRVAVYNTDVLGPEDLPDSILGFADPAWAGRLGIAPTNSSFQAHVSAMMLGIGEDATRSWLEALVANDVRSYADNAAVTRAVAAGEIEVGLVNHYYRFEVAAEDGTVPLANHSFPEGDAGAFVNVAGVGILSTSSRSADAERLVDYLTGEVGQRWVAERTWEYPLGFGFSPSVDLPPLSASVDASLGVELGDLGAVLPDALLLLADVGLL